MLYGVPSEDPALAALLARLGWEVRRDGIRLGELRFDGEGLALIAAAPHPDDPRLPVLVYAAADPAWLLGINGVFHGPHDWTVARALGERQHEIVTEGDWP